MSQGTPSGSEVSKVESDISQTISLADSIVTLLREPVALLYQNITKAQELKRSFGHWQGEAIDGDNHCRIPVLRLKEFEKYLVDTDGRLSAQPKTDHRLSPAAKSPDFKNTFRKSWGLPWSPNTSPKPDQAPTARACWAYLLRALGIHPGEGIVGWRPSTDGFINTQNGGIEMEIDGALLCHIMNLYSVPVDPAPYLREIAEQVPSCTDQKFCRFSFGTLAWEKANGQIHAHFEPGLEMELNAEKAPLGDVGSLLEPNTWIATYFSALMHGISDTDLQLAHTMAPLTERVRNFLYCFNKLKTEPWKPRVISHGWFERAARVKRRVLAQGGEDHSFFTDICENIDTDPRFADRPEKSNADPRQRLKLSVRELFLLDEETFTFWVPGGSPSSLGFIEGSPEYVVNLAVETLEGYQHQSPGTWKHMLYGMREDVINVLRSSNKIMLSVDTWLLEFTTGCPLWNERVLLGAPSVS